MQVEWCGQVTDGDLIIVLSLNWFFIRLKQVLALLICYGRQNANEPKDKLAGMLPRPYGVHTLLPKQALSFNTRAKSLTNLHKLAPFSPITCMKKTEFCISANPANSIKVTIWWTINKTIELRFLINIKIVLRFH